MSDTHPPPASAAHVRTRRLVAWVWMVPVAAVLIVVWLGWQSLSQRGPKVTITFEDAEGLDAGHTPIRFKSVQVGTVESIDLSKDLSQVVVTARMDRKIEDSLTDQTQFWVVKPRFSASGISGLSTLVSGYYIAMEPGKGKPASHFTGLSDPPVVQSDIPGTSFTLSTHQLGSLTQGSPVSYRGIEVGEVQGYTLSQDGQQVHIITFVRSPYDRLVHTNTRFWNASGVEVTTGVGGIKANIASLQALIAGGVAFDTPPGTAEPARAGTPFQLYEDESTANEQPDGPTVSYRAEFPGSVQGLGVGSPVDLMGIQVGRVTDLHLEYSVATGKVTTPVTLELEPGKVRVAGVPKHSLSNNRADIDQAVGKLVDEGLRARLISGSLITGSRIVSLEFVPNAAPAKLLPGDPMPEIPTVASSDFDGLMSSASTLMDKLAGLPLPQVMANIQNITAHLDTLTGSPALAHAVVELDKTLANLERVSNTANQQLPVLLTSLRKTSTAAEATINAANRMLGADPTAGNQGLPQTLSELTAAARSIRTLADYLDQHPEALLRGRASSP